MKKWNHLAVIGVVALASFIGGQTLAYFTDQETVTNTFTVGNLDVEEAEPDWDDTTDGKNMYAGLVQYKNPTVKNAGAVGTNPGYVRFRVTLKDGTGAALTNAQQAALIWRTLHYDSAYNGTFSTTATTATIEQGTTDLASVQESAINLPMVNPAFTLNASKSNDFEKVFEYGQVLDPQAEATLFTTVIIPSDWTSEMLQTLGSYQIDVKVEAIQSQGFADSAAAFAALDSELASSGSGSPAPSGN